MAPSTCGMQRSVYGSWTRPQSAWLATIALPSRSARSRAATARWPGLRAQGVDARVERRRRAHERLERERRGDDRGLEHPARVAQGERAAGGHQVRAVDQREALLGRELDRLEPGAPQGLAAVQRARRRRSPRPRRRARPRRARAAPDRPRHRPSRGSARPAGRRARAGRAAARRAPGGRPSGPCERLFASSSSIPRTTSAGSGSPTPIACERTRLSCSCARVGRVDADRREVAEAGRDAVHDRALGDHRVDRLASAHEPRARPRSRAAPARRRGRRARARRASSEATATSSATAAW